MAQESHPLIRLCLATCLALLLGGCPAPARRPAPEPGESPPVAAPPAAAPPAAAAAPAPAPPPRENHLSPATQSLVGRAHQQLAHGDPDGASSSIDRALRIEPRNPLLWIELGRVRLAENDPHQAENCARKALALASGDRSAQASAGRVLIEALRAQGRNPEAHEVESRPYMH